MNFPFIITRILFAALICGATSSCTTRYVCPKEVSSIRLAKPEWSLGRSQVERVSSYLPRGERGSGFVISRVESIRESAATCGNPLLLSAVTLGTLPVTLPVMLDVAVTGTDRGRNDTRHYEFGMGIRYSVWNRLLPRSSEDKAIARGLLDAVDADRRAR